MTYMLLPHFTDEKNESIIKKVWLIIRRYNSIHIASENPYIVSILGIPQTLRAGTKITVHSKSSGHTGKLHFSETFLPALFIFIIQHYIVTRVVFHPCIIWYPNWSALNLWANCFSEAEGRSVKRHLFRRLRAWRAAEFMWGSQRCHQSPPGLSPVETYFYCCSGVDLTLILYTPSSLDYIFLTLELIFLTGRGKSYGT